MMKKQYFSILALCAFFGINVTHTSNAGEVQASQERGRQDKRKLSCQEKADKVRAKVLKRCQEHRAAKVTRTSAGDTPEIDRVGRAKLSCEELADKVSAKFLTRCQRHRAAKADAQARGIYRKGDKRNRKDGQGYGRGWGRFGHRHNQPGHPLYKQEQSTAPSRRQMRSMPAQVQVPYEASLINPASIQYSPEQSRSVRMPRAYGQPMQQQEILAEPSAPVLPERELSNRETMLLMAPEQD